MHPLFNEDSELLCPACGCNFLHHERMEVFQRAEDKERGLHISVEGESLVLDTHLTGNPSARRHGLTIRFSCEGCSATPVLTLAQHKGNTLVEFHVQ